MKSLYIGLDFDGTVVKHKYPEIGEPIEEALEVIQELMDAGHKIILYTMRSDTEDGDRLQQAVDYLEGEGIELYAVNKNPSQKYWTQSPKIYCQVYIDDAALGCPLEFPEEGRPFVDWEKVREILKEREII